jgi:pimeloyl-ACP methyl ester carboxylesterase
VLEPAILHPNPNHDAIPQNARPRTPDHHCAASGGSSTCNVCGFAQQTRSANRTRIVHNPRRSPHLRRPVWDRRSRRLLAHGGRFTKESWKPQTEQLAKAGFHVLAFDFRGFGQSHGPGDKDMFTAPMYLDVLAAVRYLRKNGAKTVAVMGGSFGGAAAADASSASQPGEIKRLILLAAEGNGPAEKIKAPLLEIVARDDASGDGPRLPHIRAWFDKAPQPKDLIVLDGSAHGQFLFQTDQADRVMKEVLRFLSAKY